MKSTINSTNENTHKPYPKLMKSTVTNTIFFMITPLIGYVIHKTDEPSSIGLQAQNPSLSVLKDWDGSVTLWS